MIANWYKTRNMVPPKHKLFPTTGYIVNDVVAGFFYRTDSCVALIDGIIANPAASKTARRKSLECLYSVLIGKAYDSGYDHLLGITQHKGTDLMAKKKGATLTPYHVWALEMKGR